MPKVKYTGTSNFREIDKKSWQSIGIEDQGKVVWDRDNTGQRKDASQINEVSDAAWNYLQNNEPAEHTYEIVDDSGQSTTQSADGTKPPRP